MSMIQINDLNVDEYLISLSESGEFMSQTITVEKFVEVESEIGEFMSQNISIIDSV